MTSRAWQPVGCRCRKTFQRVTRDACVSWRHFVPSIYAFSKQMRHIVDLELCQVRPWPISWFHTQLQTTKDVFLVRLGTSLAENELEPSLTINMASLPIRKGLTLNVNSNNQYKSKFTYYKFAKKIQTQTINTEKLCKPLSCKKSCL